MKIKKYLIILFLFLLSLICAINGKMWFLLETNIITVMLSIFGVAFATFCFLFSPISNVLDKTNLSEDMEYILKKLIDSLSENLKFIFSCLIIIILIDIFYSINIPFIVNPKNINFGLFEILSLKLFLKNLVYSFILFLQFFAFYDTMNATFKIFKNCFFSSNQ